MSMKKVIPVILAAILLTVSSAALASTLALPASTRVIEAEAFYGIDLSDTEVILPDGIENIGSKAFAGTGLKRIHLPDRLTDIAEDAFDSTVVMEVNPGTPAHDWAEAHKYDIADGTLKITQIRVNRSAGAMTEDTATWTVETNDDSLVDSYGYELTLNGETLDTVSGSESPTYIAAIQQAGRYQLNVTVIAADGSTVTGSSTLYISEEAAEIECPESLENGENLEVRILEAEDAIGYGIVVAEAESGKRIYSWSFTDPRTVTVQGFLLDAGEYRVYGYVYGNRYRYAVPTVRTVSVTGTKPVAPVVTAELTGQDAYNARYSFTVTPSTFDQAAVKYVAAENSWQNTMDVSELRNYWISEDCTVALSIKVDGKWSAWSERVFLDFVEREQLATPAFTVGDSFREGEDPEITLEPVENADYYDIELFHGDMTDWEYAEGDNVFHSQFRRGGTYTLDGFGIKVPAGTYTLQVRVWSDGEVYRDNTAKRLITVMENPNRPETPAVFVNKTEAGIGSEVTFTVDTSGADCYWWENTMTRPNGSTQRWHDGSVYTARGDTSNLSTGWDADYMGCVFHNYFAVKKDGVWSQLSEAKDVTIVEREALAEPVIHIPAHPQAGRNLEISFDPVENATGYEARLYLGNTQVSWSNIDSSARTYTVNGRNMAGGNYRVKVEARDNTDTYAASTATLEFTVEGTQPAGPAVTADQTEVRAGTPIQFTINTAGWEEIYIQQKKLNASGENTGGTSHTLLPWEESTLWTNTPYYTAGDAAVEYDFYAYAHETWSLPTTIRLEVIETVQLDPPVIELAEPIAAGEDIPVRIAAVENATSYEYRIRSATGTSLYSSSSRETARTVPGYRLNPGTYTMEVTASADGYESATAKKTFTIQGMRETAPDVALASGNVANGQSAQFTIDTTEADKVAVRYYTLGNSSANYSEFNASGTETKWNRSFSSATVGTKYGYAFAVRKNGKWTAWSDTKTVTIVDQEPLGTPVISFGMAIAGQDLVFTYDAVPGATAYQISLYQDGTHIRGNTYATPVAITLPGYRVESGAEYELKVTVTDGTGLYAAASASAKVTPTGERGEAPVVTGPDGDVLTGERFSFTIDTTGAERVAMKWKRDTYSENYNTMQVLDPETLWETSVSSTGDYLYRFSLLKEGTWTAWSEAIPIHAEQGEMLQEPVITIVSGTTAGEDLVITTDEVPHAGSYYLRVNNSYGESVYSGSFSAAERRITIPGYRLSPGQYEASVSASPASSATGYIDSSATKSFMITGTKPAAPAASLQSVALRPNYGNYWQISFAVTAEGAEKVVSRSWVPGTTSVSYSLYSDPAQISTDVWVGSGTVRNYSFSVYAEGKWSAWSETVQVTFTEENESELVPLD